MFEGLFMLLTLSTIMAIASFLAGSLPLSFTLSQSRLRLVSTIGMGVLVGTALIVIIPEGVETLYSANEDTSHDHVKRWAMLGQRSSSPDLSPQLAIPDMHEDTPPLYRRDEKAKASDFNAPPGPFMPLEGDVKLDIPSSSPPKTPTEPGRVGILEDEGSANSRPTKVSTSSATISPKATTAREPHAWIGLSLILGFILMYLLDTLPFLSPQAPSRPTSNIYSLSELSSSPVSTPAPPQRSLSTTVGLCIHAAADGIALGASSSDKSTSSLSLIIFVAIMVHKAPAAFGLTSVLLQQGLGKRGARAHLVVFSLAAPAGAMLTWLLIRALGGGGHNEPAVMKWWTGVLLLFSGGTFLYVAMHTMNETDSSSSHLPADGQGNGYLEAGGSRQPRKGKDAKNPKLVFAAVAGMLLPLITQIGHAH